MSTKPTIAGQSYDFFRRLIFRFAIVSSSSARGTWISMRMSRSILRKQYSLVRQLPSHYFGQI